MLFIFFFFNDTATTEIYTLSLHDALPIYLPHMVVKVDDKEIKGFDVKVERGQQVSYDCLTHLKPGDHRLAVAFTDRKSTRLNSSHSQISYAVFCLKKKKQRVVVLDVVAEL